jgi:hypothetical protein
MASLREAPRVNGTIRLLAPRSRTDSLANRLTLVRYRREVERKFKCRERYLWFSWVFRDGSRDRTPRRELSVAFFSIRVVAPPQSKRSSLFLGRLFGVCFRYPLTTDAHLEKVAPTRASPFQSRDA